MFSTLQAHMDKGKQMANQHYENALKKAGPQAEKMRQQAVGKLTEMQENATPMLQKAGPIMQQGMRKAQEKGMQTMQESNPMMKVGMKVGMKAAPMMQQGMQQGMQKAQSSMSKMLNEAANRSQRGAAQANFQYGSPAAIATGNPTMKK